MAQRSSEGRRLFGVGLIGVAIAAVPLTFVYRDPAMLTWSSWALLALRPIVPEWTEHDIEERE